MQGDYNWEQSTNASRDCIIFSITFVLTAFPQWNYTWVSLGGDSLSRQSSHERETLRISADAAEKLIGSLREEIEHINTRIARLQTIVDAHAELSGKRPKSKRAPKGHVPKHIEEILKDGNAREESEIRKAITERFGVSYGRATVYTSLRRGLSDHRYVKDGRKWSLNPLRIATSNP